MTALRSLFLADGPSDLPLAGLLEVLCAQHRREVQITAIDPRNLHAPSRTVEDRLRFLFQQDVHPDLVFVHRDAESQHPEERVAEVLRGAVAAGVEPNRVVPVVPVRMTEAWLLLDEVEIRRVAGRPSSTNSLGLPAVSRIESVPDPKALLSEILLEAGRPAGRRRRDQFKRDFGRHRALLLQRLDLEGPIDRLPAWQKLKHDIAISMATLPEDPGLG